jgi:hypothetical protein
LKKFKYWDELDLVFSDRPSSQPVASFDSLLLGPDDSEVPSDDNNEIEGIQSQADESQLSGTLLSASSSPAPIATTT